MTDLTRRNFIIRSIGAAICAGATPIFVQTLLPLQNEISFLGHSAYELWESDTLSYISSPLTLQMFHDSSPLTWSNAV